MNRATPLVIAALAACIASAAVLAADPVRLTGRVVTVTDGDTLTILDSDRVQHRIRLDGIDAPEKAQAFGNRSRQSLAELAHDREAVATCPKVDRYGRHVCKVMVGGADVGLEQIRRGLAWHFKRYEDEQRPKDRRAYAKTEDEARAARRGLWRDPDPVAPWDWRAR